MLEKIETIKRWVKTGVMSFAYQHRLDNALTILNQLEIEAKKKEAEIIKLRKLLYQVEVYMGQEAMSNKYDGIWRDNEKLIFKNVKKESLKTKL